MTTREMRIAAEQDGRVRDGLAEVRRELGISEQFPADVTGAATRAAQRTWSDGYADATDVPFVTIDDRGAFTIVIRQPGVRAKSKGPLTVGDYAEVELATADPQRRTVLFVRTEAPSDPGVTD